MNAFPQIDRVIRLKQREQITPQGCKVVSTFYTDLKGRITECVVLSTKQEQRK